MTLLWAGRQWVLAGTDLGPISYWQTIWTSLSVSPGDDSLTSRENISIVQQSPVVISRIEINVMEDNGCWGYLILVWVVGLNKTIWLTSQETQCERNKRRTGLYFCFPRKIFLGSDVWHQKASLSKSWKMNFLFNYLKTLETKAQSHLSNWWSFLLSVAGENHEGGVQVSRGEWILRAQDLLEVPGFISHGEYLVRYFQYNSLGLTDWKPSLVSVLLSPHYSPAPPRKQAEATPGLASGLPQTTIFTSLGVWDFVKLKTCRFL